MIDARHITIALRGRWLGGYGLAFCPAHDNARTPALSLRDAEDGRLLAYCHAGCSFDAVLSSLRRLGLEAAAPRTSGCREPCSWPRPNADDARRTAATARARAIWDAAAPAAGTLAERYLRHRGILSPPPLTLRFAPWARHPSGRRFPALIAAVVSAPDERFLGLHRTYLAEPGRKALSGPAKAMLGPVGGGAVRLSDGPGPLVVAEGIETALSLRDRLRARRPKVWAALSTSGMAGLRLPLDAGRVVVAPDGDAPGRRAAEVLERRAREDGWQTYILPPPGKGLDWNDLARGAGASAT